MFPDRSLGQFRQIFEDLAFDAYDLNDPRPTHLYRRLFAVPRHRPVYLGYAARSYGCLIESAEEVA